MSDLQDPGDPSGNFYPDAPTAPPAPSSADAFAGSPLAFSAQVVPRAQQLSIGRLSGGRCMIAAAVPPANASLPRTWELLLQWTRDTGPLAVDLQLQLTLQGNVSGANEFPSKRNTSYRAGANVSAGSLWNFAPYPLTIVMIELGSGPDARVIYSDLRSGRFSLGAQEQVRVSVARWGPNNDSFDCLVQGSVAPSDGSSDYLTYSASIEIAAGDTVTMNVPPGATFFECTADDYDCLLTITNGTPATAFWVRDTTVGGAGPAFVPPTSPIALPGGTAFLFITNDSAADHVVTVEFFLK